MAAGAPVVAVDEEESVPCVGLESPIATVLVAKIFPIFHAVAKKIHVQIGIVVIVIVAQMVRTAAGAVLSCPATNGLFGRKPVVECSGWQDLPFPMSASARRINGHASSACCRAQRSLYCSREWGSHSF